MVGGSAGRATGRDAPLNGLAAGLGATGGATFGAAAGLAAAFGAVFLGLAFGAALFFAAGRLAAAFFAAGLLAVDFFAVVRFAVDFLAAERLAVDFLAEDRFAVDFLAFDFFFAGISPPSDARSELARWFRRMRTRCCYLRFIASAPRKDKHFPRPDGASVRVQPIQHGGEQEVVLEVDRDRVPRPLEPDQLLVRRSDPLHDMGRVANVDRTVAAATQDQRRDPYLREFSVEDAQQVHQALDADRRPAGVAMKQTNGRRIAQIRLVGWDVPWPHVFEPAKDFDPPIAEIRGGAHGTHRDHALHLRMSRCQVQGQRAAQGLTADEHLRTVLARAGQRLLRRADPVRPAGRGHGFRRQPMPGQ